MLFDKNDEMRNERILYQTKPNMLFGCKKAIYGFILLVIVLIVSPMVIQFIGEMQVYLISHINLALTRYAAIAFFIIILFIIIYIIWQLIGWYSKEYVLTQSRVIIKSGVLSTKKNYMPYASIQDINTSQSIFGKIFNVGSISLFSAYDNNQMVLSALSRPSEIEDIIFSHMINNRQFNNDPRVYLYEDRSYERNFQTNDNYLERNDYYDEFEPITPIGHEKNNYQRRDYEYYPDDLNFEGNSHKKYEYEPYDENFHGSESRAYDSRYEESPRLYDENFYGGEGRAYDSRYEESPRLYDENFYGGEGRAYDSGYEEPSKRYVDKSYYNEMRDEYSYNDDKYYSDNDPEIHYRDEVNNNVQDESINVDNSREKVIRRHFDKFKR